VTVAVKSRQFTANKTGKGQFLRGIKASTVTDCPVRTTGEGGSSNAAVYTFCCKKLCFSEIYVVSARARGRELS